MKKLVWFVMALMIAFVLFLVSTCVWADVYVNGYTRSDGTYVSPHYRSSPNSVTYDNYSYKGNYNPYTGELGSKTSADINYNSGLGSFDQHRSNALEPIY